MYAATLDDEFAGFISIRGAQHTLHGPHAQILGVFRTLDEARAALDPEPTAAHRASAAFPNPS